MVHGLYTEYTKYTDFLQNLALAWGPLDQLPTKNQGAIYHMLGICVQKFHYPRNNTLEEEALQRTF